MFKEEFRELFIESLERYPQELAAAFVDRFDPAAAVAVLRDLIAPNDPALESAETLRATLIEHAAAHVSGYAGGPRRPLYPAEWVVGCDAATWLACSPNRLERARAMLASSAPVRDLGNVHKDRIRAFESLSDPRALVTALLDHDDAAWRADLDVDAAVVYGRLLLRSGGLDFHVAWTQRSGGTRDVGSVAVFANGERHLVVRATEEGHSPIQRTLLALGERMCLAYNELDPLRLRRPRRRIDITAGALRESAQGRWEPVLFPVYATRRELDEALEALGRRLPPWATPKQRVAAATGCRAPICGLAPIAGSWCRTVIAPLEDGRGLAVTDGDRACVVVARAGIETPSSPGDWHLPTSVDDGD